MYNVFPLFTQLKKFWTKRDSRLLQKRNVSIQPQIRGVMSQSRALGGGPSAKGLLRWKTRTPLINWDVSLWLVPLMFLGSRVFSCADFAASMCQVCELKYGPYEILRQFQGAHFPLDQRLPLETPGWGVLAFDPKSLTDEEMKRQKENVLWASIVKLDFDGLFTEALLVYESGAKDPIVPVLTKVSSLMEALPLGGSYELVEWLWSRFMLAASRIVIEVAWSRD